MRELVDRGTDHANTSILKLGTTSTTKNLQDVEDTEIDEFTVLGAVHLGSLDDYSRSGQVDTPGKSGGTAEDSGNAVAKQTLHKIPVRTCHTGMMNTESLGHKFTNLAGPGGPHVLHSSFEFGVLTRVEAVEG